MEKRLLFIILLLSFQIHIVAQTRVAREKMEQQNLTDKFQYPRPNMVRPQWQSLNGPWDLEIVSETGNELYKGKVEVPFPVESESSGVKMKINANEKLIYTRSFVVKDNRDSKRVLVHFEGIDFHAKVFVNKQYAGEHKGGYDPFYFDISDYLIPGSNQTLKVEVQDPTDAGNQSRGKQVSEPGGIYYTSASGIWQSVWLETVPDMYIKSYHYFPDIDNSNILLIVKTNKKADHSKLNIRADFKGKEIYNQTMAFSDSILIPVNKLYLWTPEQPNLYQLQIRLLENDHIIDEIEGYFGMRKVALSTDGVQKRILLNNQFVFQNGVLDQGYWPDGIYTAPDDEALKNDIVMAKKLGFNMLRKHVKVEPRRFYYWCDVLGMLVWQDMPSGDTKIGVNDKDIDKKKEDAIQFEYELNQMIETLHNHPSIIMWIPFNEGWGQYDTKRIVELVKHKDPGRLVSNASGWVDRGVGDIYDIHPYPEPRLPKAQKDRAIVIGEFGGVSLKDKSYVWSAESWGYSELEDSVSFLDTYESFYDKVWEMKDHQHLSAVVYTQLTDVETETNGLITYNRGKSKLSFEKFHAINTGNYLPKPQIYPKGGLANIGDSVFISQNEQKKIYYTINGEEPDESSELYREAIVLDSGINIRAKVLKNGIWSRTTNHQYTITKTPRPVYAFPYEKYTAGGDFALIDGKEGSKEFNDGNWQGFLQNDLDIIIESEETNSPKTIELNFLENTKSWIFLPAEICVYISGDGMHFQKIKCIQPEQSKKHREAGIYTFDINIERSFKYLKVIARNMGFCPEWHEAKGEKAWIFIDEIQIR